MEGVLVGDNSLPTDVRNFVKLLGPGLTAFFEFDFIVVNFDNFYVADNISFMNEMLTD